VPDERRHSNIPRGVAYAERFNLPVFPCRPRRKTPLTQHGCKDATKDRAQISTWWSRWPDANTGIATGAISGIVVLDIDPYHGGHQSLVTLAAKYGELPIAPTVLTGGNGLHDYFRAGPDSQIHNSAGVLGSGLDVRGEGGYVIAPPSWHPSGQAYRWAPEARIDEVELAPPPDWLITLLVSPPVRAAANQTAPWPMGTRGGPVIRLDLTELAAGVSEGQRDDRLFRLACYLRWRGYPRDQADQIVVDAAGRCRPPFPARAALRKVDSAWRYAP